MIGSSWMPFLIFNKIFVFQLSSRITWSNSYTAVVNVSASFRSMARMRISMNLYSLVDEYVVSRDAYFLLFRSAKTVSYVSRQVNMSRSHYHKSANDIPSWPARRDTNEASIP